jgi:hypothetical protein
VNFRYRAYGLELTSSVPIPALAPTAAPAGEAHLEVHLGEPPAWAKQAIEGTPTRLRTFSRSTTQADPGFTLAEYAGGRSFELSYADGTRFVVDESTRRVWGQAAPDLSHEDLCVYLAGPVLGFVLRRRGWLALHASVPAIRGRGIALCGEAGSGKSTTAAALALRGWPILSEDICALAEVEGTSYVLPGYPRVCLWPDSVNLLFQSPEALPLIVPKGWEKRYLPLDGARARFAEQAVPLAAIFLLTLDREADRAPSIEPLSKRHAVLQLVRNTYMNWLLDRWQRASEFDAIVNLVSRVPCYRVTVNRGPARLGELASLIESHAPGDAAFEASLSESAV